MSKLTMGIFACQRPLTQTLARKNEFTRIICNCTLKKWHSTRPSENRSNKFKTATLFLTGFGVGLSWAKYSGESSGDESWLPSVTASVCLGNTNAGKQTFNFLTDIINKYDVLLPTVHAASPTLPPDDPPNSVTKRQKFNFIAEVVKTCKPSVVYIEIIDTRFNRVVSNGSGFIVSEDGLILTNAHVVTTRARNRVQVRLSDGQSFTAQIEDADMSSDLALIRIPCRKLPTMKLGVSNDLEAGEFVVAIGSPLSLSNTVTAGVVSSTSRKGTELGLHGREIDYIQTDASITFGNSGGPLVNLDGEAIGINSMKITAGISFAIPIDYAKQFLAKSKERTQSKGWFSGKEPPHRRYMGITMVTLTPQILLEMQQRNMFSAPDVTHGVLVVKVVVGSPAYTGGLKPGDIVTHINGNKVESATSIYDALDSSHALSMTVVRESGKIELTVVPED